MLVSFAVPASSAVAQQPLAGPPEVLDGPNAGIAGLDLSVARDGGGALVYLKQGHVFASLLRGGSFQPSQELDAGLDAASSQPVVAAGNGGLVVVAFIDGGQLYVVSRPAGAGSWTAPQALASGAANPAVQMSNLGKAYLAFSAAAGGGYDVRVAYYYQGSWTLAPSPLNQVPADDAGSGSGRPRVAAAGDGVAIVAWGERGHVFTRRVWASSPSAVVEQADGPPPGCTELSADEPEVGSGGDSSYAAVAFHETVRCGAQQTSRVVVNRLHGSVYDGVRPADGLAGGSSGGADQPGVAVSEFGHGWITSAQSPSAQSPSAQSPSAQSPSGQSPGFDVVADYLGDNDVVAGSVGVNGEPNASAPAVVPAIAGVHADLIAWQHDPGAGGAPDIRVRYAPSGGSSLGPELAISSPAQGPADAGAGFAAAGDAAGDAAVAWVQGAPGSAQIVVAQLYQRPPAPVAVRASPYVRTARPLLRWSFGNPNAWGPFTYTVRVDGAVAGQTGASALAVGPLRDGRHTWQVTAGNPTGQTSTMRPVKLFVDTVAPRVSLRVGGARKVGSLLHLFVRYSDGPPSRASGVVAVLVRWGDGTTSRIGHSAAHVYKRAGRYKLVVVVRDRAGNVTTRVRYLKVGQ